MVCISVSILTFTGVSDFVDSPAHRKALKSNGCTLSCGFGLHSKAFVTMLLHLAFALSSPIDGLPRVYKGEDPKALIVSTINSTIMMYMNVRRKG